ncbi:MAG: molybdopterin cofactor-binding domain-containing protein [Gemmatimonadales bacterium]|nr:molybdopterin cofactor-binding domain-containing protein [Gemmatimonadales bacterium]
MMTGTMDRRAFMGLGAAAGSLVLGVRWRDLAAEEAAPAEAVAAFGAWLEIAPDDGVTIWFAKSEMGQGTYTGLPMLIAEELDADWARVTIRQADLDARFGSQTTGGSGSIRRGWEPLRRAGAQARAMLVAAAAEAWGVPGGEITVAKGALAHARTGRSGTFGAFAARAAALPVPAEVTLKPRSAFTLIGTSPPRREVPDKVTGRSTFGIDVRRPGMRFAAIAKAPVLGGRALDVDAADALRVPGVLDVRLVQGAVVVLATNTWAAFEGRRRLAVRWDDGPHRALSSDALRRRMTDRVAQAGVIGRNDGDAAAALAGAARVVEARYDLPFLAHVPLEPQNCTAMVQGGRCELWAPTQNPARAAQEAAQALGLATKDVTVHVTFMGGGFGRRLFGDFAADAARAAALAPGTPVQVVWSREDDLAHDFYRPMSHHWLRAAFDASGRARAWFHRFAGPSITAQQFPQNLRNGYDAAAFDGADNVPYAFAAMRVEHADVAVPVPVGWWRSVWASQHAFANECFADECAAALGQDPVAFRLALLGDAPRHRRVVELAAERAGWGSALPPGRARGIAVHESFQSIVCEVAEVSLDDGRPRVHRVTSVVDCGIAVHPDLVRAQTEGAVTDGISAALYGEVTIEGGRPVQRNFHEYQLLRMHEAPRVDVHLVDSGAPPGGVGEPGLPPAAPAVANAVRALTGEPVRALPLRAGRRVARGG